MASESRPNIDSESRPDPARIEVIGVGMGRTGTVSLRKALEILGFSPAYHPLTSPTMYEDFFQWADIIEGKDTSPAAFDKVLRGYRSVVDTPISTVAKAAYNAYPNAKFILTVRDPAKWEHSIKTTVEAYCDEVLKNEPSPESEGMTRWIKAYLGAYHKGRLITHPRDEYERHNEHIKSIIPVDQLLIYNVTEGWGRLANFLKVPKPDVAFPHLNDSTAFFQTMKKHGEKITKEP